MATKSIYHKTYEQGEFSGEQFFLNAGSLKSQEIVFVISAEKKNGKISPFLEGKFRVKKVYNGSFEFNEVTYAKKLDLESLIRPTKKVSLDLLRKRIGPGDFAKRFLNHTKPLLEKEEIDYFDELLGGVTPVAEMSVTDSSLESDLTEIAQGDTEKVQEILARVGQGKFRKNVAKVWSGGTGQEVCAASGLSLPEMLNASHIVPWSECIGEDAHKRLDGTNGLLLCTHIDRLFDRYLLTFQCRGSFCEVKYSKRLGPTEIATLFPPKVGLGLELRGLNDEDRRKVTANLEQHLAKFEQKEALR